MTWVTEPGEVVRHPAGRLDSLGPWNINMLSGGMIMKKILALVFAFALMASPALAFHDGGVAACNGCHTMHNSEDGVPIDAAHPMGNAYLLKAGNASDVCLGCHATSRGAVWGADPLAPPTERGAGNFTFLMEDNINDGHRGASNPIPGYEAGHSVVGNGYNGDPVLAVAPGGSFPSAALGCSSCHDPHGNEHFRLLYGAGGSVQDGLAVFTNAAPTAVGLSLFGAGESATNHTAYQGGMSAWCGNCHGNFHDEAGGRLIHPSGSALGGTVATAYNLYNGTADQTGGAAATAYLAQVPFEDAANTTASTAGPSASSQVACITCHRAHASSAPNAGRWDFNVPFLHEDGVESGSYQIPDPYGDMNQRSLCNKCHVKDKGDHMPSPSVQPPPPGSGDEQRE